MKFLSHLILVIILAITVYSCSNKKHDGSKRPVVSDQNRTGAVTDHHQLDSSSINLSANNVTASVPLTNPVFFKPNPAINCNDRIFTQSLNGTRVQLSNDGSLQFLYQPQITPGDNPKSDRADKVFFKISILNNDKTKLEKTIFLDFMDKANHDSRNSYIRGKNFFCDNSGELYIQTSVMSVYEAQAGSGFFLSKEDAFQIIKFYHVDTKNNIGALTEKRLITHFDPQTFKVINNERSSRLTVDGSESI